ncbi:MAG: PqqD family protein [Desulfobacteraceae bacterium]|nr:PqqD family protein [Desulfobacteraceae bacterium]
MAFDISKLQRYAFSASGLIFDPESGSIFTTNQMGLSILADLKAGLNLEQIKERLAAEYEVPAAAVLDRDVGDFVSQLLALDIVQEKE